MNTFDAGVAAWRQKEGAGWVTAYVAWRIVSNLTPYTTKQYADALAVSPQYIRRMKRAYDMYAYLKGHWADGAVEYPLSYHPRFLRKGLTLEHFVELAEYQEKWRTSPSELFSALHTAYEHRISAKAMRFTLEEEASGRATQPQWWGYLSHLAEYAGKLMGEGGAPLEVRHAAAVFMGVAQGYLEEGELGW